MNRTKINYFIDIITALFFLVCAGTGLIIFFFLPEGIRHGGTQEFLGLNKNVWVDIHDFSGILFSVLILVHLILHWDWFKCITKNFFQKEKVACETSDDVDKSAKIS